jgi:hypothetical protein
MRTLYKAMLLGFALALAGPLAGEAGASDQRASHGQGGDSGVSLELSVGYGNIFRGTAWTPLHVSLHNRSNSDVSGVLAIPSSTDAAPGPLQPVEGSYQRDVVLPAHGTKNIVLYVPGSAIQDRARAVFQAGSRVLAAGTAFPVGIDSSTLLLGALEGSPLDGAWLAQLSLRQVTTHVVTLTPSAVDTLPEALSAFDAVVVTDVDTSQLDATQLSALRRYVRSGGALLLVGGPSWQGTLGPLPASLLPGRIVGTRTLPDLHGLSSLGRIPSGARGQTAVVSDLIDPRGTVLAQQAGVPLAVTEPVGKGVIEYLAFDPSLSPVKGWSSATGLMQSALALAAPSAVGRTVSPQGIRARFARAFGSVAIVSELANIPAGRLPLLAVLALLTAIYVVLLGPVNFLFLRWRRRANLAWVTIPVLSLAWMGSTAGAAAHLRGSEAILNSVGVVSLDGRSGSYPATFYVGLDAPLNGTYQVTYNHPALAVAMGRENPDWSPWGRASGSAPSVQASVTEGPQTTISFPGMKAWSMRELSLTTNVAMASGVSSKLRIAANGDIVGTIHNGTPYPLLHPLVVASQGVERLPAIAAGATARVRVRPSSDASTEDQGQVAAQLYGGSSFDDGDGFWGGGPCCGARFQLNQESSLSDRIQNVTSMLLQNQAFSPFGHVTLLAWIDRPLTRLYVNGNAPQRRDLNLVVAPLGVTLAGHGPFQLRNGTVSPHLVDVSPQAPQSTCCWLSHDQHALSIGVGGFATFAFDIPASGPVHFRRLRITVDNEIAAPHIGHLYDWRTGRWLPIDLDMGSVDISNPDRFVSAHGELLLRLTATSDSGDIAIPDPNQNFQLSGVGSVT